MDENSPPVEAAVDEKRLLELAPVDAKRLLELVPVNKLPDEGEPHNPPEPVEAAVEPDELPELLPSMLLKRPEPLEALELAGLLKIDEPVEPKRLLPEENKPEPPNKLAPLEALGANKELDDCALSSLPPALSGEDCALAVAPEVWLEAGGFSALPLGSPPSTSANAPVSRFMSFAASNCTLNS
jgi:hypothetical protein